MANITRIGVGQYYTYWCWPILHVLVLANITRMGVGQYYTYGYWPVLHVSMLVYIARTGVGQYSPIGVCLYYKYGCWPVLHVLLLTNITRMYVGQYYTYGCCFNSIQICDNLGKSVKYLHYLSDFTQISWFPSYFVFLIIQKVKLLLKKVRMVIFT